MNESNSISTTCVVELDVMSLRAYAEAPGFETNEAGQVFGEYPLGGEVS